MLMQKVTTITLDSADAQSSRQCGYMLHEASEILRISLDQCRDLSESGAFGVQQIQNDNICVSYKNLLDYMLSNDIDTANLVRPTTIMVFCNDTKKSQKIMQALLRLKGHLQIQSAKQQSDKVMENCRQEPDLLIIDNSDTSEKFERLCQCIQETKSRTDMKVICIDENNKPELSGLCDVTIRLPLKVDKVLAVAKQLLGLTDDP